MLIHMDRETFLDVEKRAAKAGLKLAELLSKAGVSYSTWGRWKRGQIGPQMRTWNKILSALEEAEKAAVAYWTTRAGEAGQATQDEKAA